MGHHTMSRYEDDDDEFVLTQGLARHLEFEENSDTGELELPKVDDPSDTRPEYEKFNEKYGVINPKGLKGYIGKNPKDRERHARILEEEPAQHLKWQEDLDRHKWPRSTKWKHKSGRYLATKWGSSAHGVYPGRDKANRREGVLDHDHETMGDPPTDSEDDESDYSSSDEDLDSELEDEMGPLPLRRFKNRTTGTRYDDPYCYGLPYGPNEISIYDIITEQTLEERDELEFRVNCAKREYNEVQIWEDFRKRNEKQNDLYRDILKAEYKGYQPKQYFHDYIHEKNYRPKHRVLTPGGWVCCPGCCCRSDKHRGCFDFAWRCPGPAGKIFCCNRCLNLACCLCYTCFFPISLPIVCCCDCMYSTQSENSEPPPPPPITVQPLQLMFSNDTYEEDLPPAIDDLTTSSSSVRRSPRDLINLQSTSNSSDPDSSKIQEDSPPPPKAKTPEPAPARTLRPPSYRAPITKEPTKSKESPPAYQP